MKYTAFSISVCEHYHVFKVFELVNDTRRRLIHDFARVSDQDHELEMCTDSEKTDDNQNSTKDDLRDGLTVDEIFAEEILDRWEEGDNNA